MAETDLGTWLRQRRKYLDITQRDLAERVGCSLNTIRKIEAGERRPSRQMAELLAGALQVPSAQIPLFVRFARRTSADDGTQPAFIVPHAADRGEADTDIGGIFNRDTRPSVTLHSSNLPAPRNGFVGRSTELLELHGILADGDTRLLTLTGPPGVGKTRLALEVARTLFAEGRGPWSVCFVPLASIGDPQLVLSTVVRTLGVPEVSARQELDGLRSYLSDKHLLLVLDNFEQILPAASEVAELLAVCSLLRVLVTSRVALNIYGEQLYSVPPLSLASPSEAALSAHDLLRRSEAVELFVQRSISISSRFNLTPDNAPTIAEVCRRLDGLPLAIELAAARTNVLPPRALLERLDVRLALLTSGAKDLHERQRTLRGAIAWSYDLLSSAEKSLFGGLSVFEGGSDLSAIEEICTASENAGSAILDQISALLSSSLLESGEYQGKAARYRMLPTIREYAEERLAESGNDYELRMRHAVYYLALAERAEPLLFGPEQMAWLDRLEEEHDNMRAALGWLLGVDHADGERAIDAVTLALRLCGTLSYFWDTRGYLEEGMKWLQVALAGGEAAPPGVRAKALKGAGNLASEQGDFDRARTLYEDALALYRDLRDETGIARLLNNLGILAREQGDHAMATSLYEEGLAVWRKLGDKWYIAAALNNLGSAYWYGGQYERARALHEESLSIRYELGDEQGIAASLGNLGDVAQKQKDYSEARRFHRQSLSRYYSLGDKREVAECLEKLAELIVETSSPSGAEPASVLYQAVILLAAAAEVRESISAPVPPTDRAHYEETLEATRLLLGDTSWRQAWSEGHNLGLDHAVKLGLELDQA